MNNVAWHENCVLRDDVRQGTLTLAEFAADLNAVRTGDAPNVYRLHNLFFDRTYPTDNLKSLVRDVLHRLSGRGGAPVIRVQVAYGGGKTHALIALLHLAERGTELETHPTVGEFMGFSGLNQLPQARVVLLPFDQFGVIEGLSVKAPDGRQKTVKTPWGALAYQLAGEEGLEKVAEHESRYITPAEPTLVELLKTPQASGMSTLILMDETLWYMRNAVDDDSNRLGVLRDFFQVLTQAVGKVDRAALVASVISRDVVLDDSIDIQCLNALENVFHRVEETKEPVSGEDIPELLRRRLFESVDTQNKRRPIVDRLTTAMQRLPLRPSQRNQSAKERLLESYPFHPDLLEVFYQKWTGLTKLQRTRGVLRTFAMALRDSEGKDLSAFVGAGTLLGSDGELSEAVRELIETCNEGNQWTPILRGELGRAREIQAERKQLRKHREIEQSVLATFLHSQPAGQKADESGLYALLAHSEIDLVSVEDGLAKWREISWFLKENDRSWSLGIASNLTKMHVEAMRILRAEQIKAELLQRIKAARMGQTNDDLAVHALPDSPNDILDNADIHFVIVAPDHEATPGEEVSDALRAYFDRAYKNHVILLAPNRARLAGVRNSIRNVLAWHAIESGDEMDTLSESQKALLQKRKCDDEHRISDSVKSAYSVLIALDEDGDIEARQLPPGTEPALDRVKAFLEEEERLLTTALDPYLLTPDSYLELWSDDETSKPVQRLYGMFASLPRLPKLLSRQVFLDTLRRGVAEGKIVFRDVRGDGSQNTYWRRAPDDELLWQRGAEIVPVEHAELHHLEPELLRPNAIPELWQPDEFPLKVSEILEYFNGEDAPKLASDEILFGAVKSTIEARFVMGRRGGEDNFGEDVAHLTINAEWELLPPPAPIRGSEIAHTLPEAWEDGTSTVGRVRDALAKQRGAKPPWMLIKDAVDQGKSAGLFEITTDNPAWWSCTADQADRVGLRVSEQPMRLEPGEIAAVIPATSGSVALGWIKEKLESTKDIPIPDDVFRDAVNEALNRKLIVSDGQPVDDYYQTRVREPDWVRHSESRLTETEVQDLAGRIGSLSDIAPELEFEFRLVVTAEGERPSDEVLEELNEVLGEVAESLKFGSDGS